MKANAINPITINYRGSQETSKKQRSLLDKFETEVRNSADMSDTLQVPRTIFKGYLAFMVSTTMVTLASFINAKHAKLKKGINISSALLALYGTYSFVRPYLIKDDKGKKSQ